MTYAPQSLTDLMAYLGSQGVRNLGIVGGPTHTYGYHLGRDRVYGTGGQGANDYSVQLARDKAGLSDAASAVDLGRVNGELTGLQQLTAWLWAECQAEKPDTRTIREVLGSADGRTVRCWVAREAGGPTMLDNCADASHLTHTHISFFRDTEAADQRPLFRRYFEEEDMALQGSNPVRTPNRKTRIVVAPVGNFMAGPTFVGGQGVQYPTDTVISPVDFQVDGQPNHGTPRWYYGAIEVPGVKIHYGYIHESEIAALEPIEIPPDTVTPAPPPTDPDIAAAQTALAQADVVLLSAYRDAGAARTKITAGRAKVRAANAALEE